MDVRQVLWESSCLISQHIDGYPASLQTPPQELEHRFNGGVSHDVSSHYARIITSGNLPPDARVLDMGCGYGRIALSLIRKLAPGQRYVGLDPSADGIAWARSYISPVHPDFSFERIDIQSGPYNPAGALRGADFRFPFDDGCLDLVFMISVLTHVDLATTASYIREAARVLKPASGRLIATFFLLDEETDQLIAAGKSRFTLPWAHGDSRIQDHHSPELVIAHPRQAVVDLLDEAGFAHHSLFYGHWSGRTGHTAIDFQDLVIADRSVGDAHELPQAEEPPCPDGFALAGTLHDRLGALGDGSRHRLMDFIAWSASLTLNVLWWHDEGQQLSIRSSEESAAQPLPLNLAGFRDLQLEKRAHAAHAGGHSYLPVDEQGLIALLVGTGATQQELLACMVEVAENGLVVLDALTRGDRFFLTTTDGQSRMIALPRFVG